MRTGNKLIIGILILIMALTSFRVRFIVVDRIDFGLNVPIKAKNVYRSGFDSFSSFKRVSFEISSDEFISFKRKVESKGYSKFEMAREGFAADEFWIDADDGVYVSMKKQSNSIIRIFYIEGTDAVHITKFYN